VDADARRPGRLGQRRPRLPVDLPLANEHRCASSRAPSGRARRRPPGPWPHGPIRPPPHAPRRPWTEHRRSVLSSPDEPRTRPRSQRLRGEEQRAPARVARARPRGHVPSGPLAARRSPRCRHELRLHPSIGLCRALASPRGGVIVHFLVRTARKLAVGLRMTFVRAS
jgi:hypothetical protein